MTASSLCVEDREESSYVATTLKTAQVKRKPTITLDRSNAKRGIYQYLAILIWLGWPCFYFISMLTLPLAYNYCPVYLIGVTCLMVFSAFMPIHRASQPQWGKRLGNFILFKAADYFRIRMILVDEEAVRVAGPSIFAIEPHDLLPLSIFAFNDCLRGLKGHTCLGCVTSFAFYMPIIKHIYTWVNAVPADKSNLRKMLKNGISPVLCPGGVQEVTLMKSDKECVLYLNSRFGFIKLALQYGVPIIPCFCFGLRKTFAYHVSQDEYSKYIGRVTGVLPVLFLVGSILCCMMMFI